MDLPRIDADRTRGLAIAGCVLVLLLAASGIRPYDRLTWMLEVFPVVIVVPVLVATYRRFPLTTLLYALIFCHAMVLMVGGMYTYARVPLGFGIEELLSLHRNPYDKIGHFAQGFVPAIAAREILIRLGVVARRGWIAFIVLCIVLAVSATYELVEWAAAVIYGQDADAFLGTQGDTWDTQSDMLFAAIGGAAALAMLSGIHDRQIAKIPE